MTLSAILPYLMSLGLAGQTMVEGEAPWGSRQFLDSDDQRGPTSENREFRVQSTPVFIWRSAM